MRPRGRLFRRYIVLFAAVVSAVLLVSGALEIYFSHEEAKAALAAVQREKALAAAARIEQFVREIERQLGWTTHPLLTGGAAAVEQRRIDYFRLLRQVPAITELSHLDATGREQIRISRLAMDVAGSAVDYSSDPRFLQAKGGRTYFSPVYFRKESEPYMTVSMSGGSAQGVTVAEVNLKFIWDVVSQIKIGQAGHAYVVDARGQLIAHPDISLVLKKSDLSGLEQVQAARARTDARGSDETISAQDLHGRRVLAAHAPITPLGWLVLVEQPLAEAFEPIHASIIRTVLLVLAGVGLSGMASLVLARRMVRPIQTLGAGAARIGAGDLGHRIQVQTGDEIEALADEFNRMAGTLQESYAGLERKVEERTSELREALEQLTALSSVGQAVTSTLDLPTVLDTIANHAIQLSGAEAAAIHEYDEAAEVFSVRATRGFGPRVEQRVRQTPVRRGEGVLGTVAVTREVVQVADLTQPGAYTGGRLSELLDAGFRAMLAVPLLREQQLVGGLVVARKRPGEFSADVVNLLRTFATQSALAILNAQLFRALEDKSRELEVASRHKSEFLAAMSHELRTPLNAVIGFSEVLLERMFGDLNPKQEEYLHDIVASGRHLLSLINDILDLAKVEAGRMDLELGTFSLPAALDNALTLIRERAARHGITVAASVDPRVDRIVADERKFKQIVVNLLSNAIKFTPEGGRIDVMATPADGVVEVSVTDTGIGIAAEDQEAIFEEFRQVGNDYGRKREGTGLGLPLTKRFVELHGGRIWVKSRLGAGSTFTFTLPLQQQR